MKNRAAPNLPSDLIGQSERLTHLGSGLVVGRASDEEPRLRALREGPRAFRAAIQGIKDETVVCTWQASETHPSAAEALEAARAALGQP